jgi:type IV pilus assembly protein PilE
MLSARRAQGLTLIELMTVMLVVAVFAALMLPSFQAQVLKARRSDAYSAITLVQQSQERWRAHQSTYATALGDLGLGTASTAGHYEMGTATETTSAASRYVVSAAASGAQTADNLCRYLRLVIDGGQWQESSGPDTSYSNDPANNRRCWNR